MTARPCPLPIPSGRPAGVVRPSERARASIVLISRRHSKGTEFRGCQSHIGLGSPARRKRPPSFSRAAFYRLKLWI